MGMLPSHIGAMVLASAIACAGLTPAAAAPTFLPATPKLRSDVVLAQNSEIIRRENSHHDGGDGRSAGTIAATTATLPGTIMTAPGSSARELPRNTPTTHTAIIAGMTANGWDADRWHDWDGNRWRDWDGNRWDGEKRKHRVRIHKRNSFTVQGPSEALQDILTAVPQ